MEQFLSRKRKRWFAVVWGLGLTMALVLPDVDRWIQQHDELDELRRQVALRADLPVRARKLANRVEQKKEELAVLEANLIPAASLSSFNRDVTRAVHAANCRVRSLRPGSGSRRPLAEVLGNPDAVAKQPNIKSAWQVEEQVSAISIQGAFGDLVRFVSKLDDETRVLQLASLDVYAPPETTEELVLDVHIRTLDLLEQHGP